MEPLATSIRQSIDIKGIVRSNKEHKISLYADDVLLYVSDPLSSILYILNTLEDFGKFSGYKLNLGKSELLPINIANQSSFNSLPFKIINNKLKYLGISLTKSHSQLLKANFTPLLNHTRQDLLRWSNMPLSLVGRINTVKMNILPKFLYLFQCIPQFLTKAFFKKLDTSISSFIWSNKTARIRKIFLQRPKMHGGLALPSFQIYYWAANIKTVLHWMSDTTSHDTPAWLQIELSSCTRSSLPAFLCSSIPLCTS